MEICIYINEIIEKCSDKAEEGKNIKASKA